MISEWLVLVEISPLLQTLSKVHCIPKCLVGVVYLEINGHFSLSPEPGKHWVQWR